MGQVKKAHLREAILASAHKLFSGAGYQGTSVPRIAAGAGVSTANVYVYFRSKLDILYAIYDPWLRARLMRLEAELLLIAPPRERMKHLFRTLWRDIPSEKNGFANNVMQAISSMTRRDRYKPVLLRQMEVRLGRMLAESLPPERRRVLGRARLGHLLVMAFDGFIIYQHVNPRAPLDDATLEAVCSMLLGES